MSDGEPEVGGGGDLIANRDTESPEELPSQEAPKATTEESEPDPLGPSNPSPGDGSSPDIPTDGAASPELLLAKEDAPGGEVSSEEKDPVVLANPVFDEKVEARIELKAVARETIEVKEKVEVVEKE